MNTLSFKIYILDSYRVKEIRRFSIEEDICTNFAYLEGKIRNAVPDLLRKNLKIMWKDGEGDYITISSDEELITAVYTLKSGTDCLKIYVKENESTCGVGTEQVDHPGVTCDGCDQALKGCRYKCMTCYDYDLCSPCHQKGTHSEHDMMCIRRPRSENVHVFGFSPMWGCRRSRPFCRGKSRMEHGCPRHEKTHCGEGNSSAKEEQAKDGLGCEEVLGHVATVFGLDPDVAVSTAKAMMEDLHLNVAEQCKSEPAKECSSKVPSEKQASSMQSPHSQTEAASQPNVSTTQHGVPSEETFKGLEQVLGDFAKQLGFDATKLNEMAKSASDFLLAHATQSQQVPSTSSSNSHDSTQPAEKAPGHIPSDSIPDARHPYSGLSQVLSHIFTGLETGQGSTINERCEDSGNASKQDSQKVNDDFVIVDKTKQDQKPSEAAQSQSSQPDGPLEATDMAASYPDERRFHQRLDTALKQMEAMGFKNEGGWLTQLLIAKQLNISAVLDALNPH